MDDEARQQLIAQATLQNARDEARRARANVPIGVGLILVGVVISVLVATLPLGLVGSVLISGIGFVFVPSGIAVIARAHATIAHSKRRIRELEPPAARLLTRS